MNRAARDKFRPRLTALILLSALTAAVLAILVYLPAFDLGFVNWDDPEYVTANLDLRRPTGEFLRWAVTNQLHGNWHPITWLSLRIDQMLGGGSARPFHATSVLLHAANSALVVLVALALAAAAGSRVDFRAVMAAAALGCVFAVHPLHVESVAWISERKDLLYASFWLLSLLAYIRYASQPRVRRVWYAVSLICFLTSLASKPMAVTLVAILLLCDLWPLARIDRASWRRIAVEKVPFLAAGTAVAVMTIAGQREAGAMASLDQLPLARRLIGAGLNLGFYLAKSVVPIRLSPLYPVEAGAPVVTLTQGLGLLSFCAWCLVAWRRRARRPSLGFAVLGFAASLAPILGLLQTGSQLAADRYAYLAVAFPVGVLVYGFGALAARSTLARRLTLAALLVALSALALGTRLQLRHWRDSPALWARVLAFAPGHPSAHYNLGEHYRAEGDIEAAVHHWRLAVAAEPAYSRALNQLATVELIGGNLPDAERLYRRAVDADDRNVEALYNLILTLDRQGRFHISRPWVEKFLERAGPEYAEQRAWVQSRREELLPEPLAAGPRGAEPP